MSHIYIATSRFNDQTWNENSEFRNKHNFKGCIYGAPLQIAVKIPLNSPVFIVEMNNSTNKIEGIGLIKNLIQFDKYYQVYKTGNYNRYTYKSNYRIDRAVLENYNLKMVNLFDHILFKEKTHMKRGSGITTIPEKLLKHKLCTGVDFKMELRELFQRYFNECVWSDPKPNATVVSERNPNAISEEKEKKEEKN